jgi:5'-nucleotidase
VPAPSGINRSGVYLGGHAGLVEQYLGVSGSRILYVGDHIYGDVHVSKSILRWRTGLVLRELEDELRAIEQFRPLQLRLSALMSQKVRLNRVISQIQLAIQRAERGHSPPAFFSKLPTTDGQPPSPPTVAQLRADLDRYRAEFAALDDDLRPLALASSTLSNPRWGLLTRTGNDKSHLARHLERHADIYFSRVSSFLYETPFAYLQAGRGSLPHDADVWMPHDPPPTHDL